MIKEIGNNIMLREFSSFEVDEHNSKVLRFLTYYFNDCKLAEEVFPDENYKIHKNILLVGEPGTGKTMLMQVFSEYLKRIGGENFFWNLSTTQMMNYYKINGHIDRYTYNECASEGKFDGNPINVCLNDVGLLTENQKNYGTDLSLIMDEFLFARYEIYQNSYKKYHLTSNLSVDEFVKRFEGRLVDRFKSFNVISLNGKSRRK
ncbi:energy-coupling factor transporter ATP-binding protein EcfA2 [Dysgonomonas sp. PFB1-18]|uniref:AAA family ATPase n=1 Tax=unclassified Dysgonomonas TaxID=2630389 RepID=UPI0024736DDC|nr:MULTISPECIES: AAA family ATPase [unclassified Dysgonomonas]MDH6307996.1 energy-coupling factor transporter ATP-binding protein EcfA2 [Dysgonomonas sp. PF1-14]MDH6339535.1 energy-coupling factor transporter ATP-binding protein EcfA2 [Dysgonomonas sp. PF1-16]MDH6381186.1 energy-coupling factor transporter ATP-binding protein EcfA2 [Dysgonomonas sp. PFB1-18]MDH6398398.1 energy-coupling factor transporter ATP-binding protein EcfA2 [Dysgonomonas sp. PF1-23]